MRYLAKKEAGYGTLIHAISTDEEMTLKRYKELHPEVFEVEGFYCLVKSVGNMNVEPKNG